MTLEPVRASGGLVFRPGETGVEVLIVHRPRYDDWSLPKGKREPGETPEATAVREVAEETGQVAHIVAPLEEIAYELPDGRRKEVAYFAMRPVSERTFHPNEEVDECRWVPVGEAADLLTYERDRRMATETDLASLTENGIIYLIRHAVAESRQGWEGDDRLRPLTEKGWRQAEAIADWLGSSQVDLILSSPYARCRQTVEPLSRRTGIPTVDEPALAEGAQVQALLSRIAAVAGLNIVMSSHGDVIPELLRALDRRGVDLIADDGSTQWRKGSMWVIELAEGTPIRAAYRPPPQV